MITVFQSPNQLVPAQRWGKDFVIINWKYRQKIKLKNLDINRTEDIYKNEKNHFRNFSTR